MTNRESTDRIVVHHSLSKDVSAEEIDRWHRARKMSCIGYHFVIRADGTIERGRDLDKKGAHARGKNHNSIGVCFTGDFRYRPPTIEQYDAFIDLYSYLERIYGDHLTIEPHRTDFEGNQCPGPQFDMRIIKYWTDNNVDNIE